MALVLGLDLGTTTVTAVALDARRQEVRAAHTVSTPGEIIRLDDPAGGRREFDADALLAAGLDCLRGLAGKLGPAARDAAGLGITGQQHGVVVIDHRGRPRTPFINWQDRRGEDPFPDTEETFVERARRLAGPDAPARTGCRLSAGYLGVTLFWLRTRGLLPAGGTACSLTDLAASAWSGAPPATDPTSAASGGLLDLDRLDWDRPLLAALGLPEGLFPPVRPSGERRGGLTAEAAGATGLAEGLPVFLGVGDNQASFLGSVAAREDAVLVNIGTGGQVSRYADRRAEDSMIEARPFPGGGYLLVAAGLSGGAAYAVLEGFFRAVGRDLLGAESGGGVYAAMNRLAARVPAGADGLRCEPYFSGTRHEPDLRASWAGISAGNFTPGHVTRALLEGMARTFALGRDAIDRALGSPARALVGAGNGVRANPLLARLVGEALGLPLHLPREREEAACGAARLASVGAGLFPDLARACAGIVTEPADP